MAETASIRISGLQREISDEPTVVECAGSFHSDGSRCYIRYTDPDGIHNLIKIRPGCASVTRSGSFSSEMIFDESTATSCVYPTEYGTFDTDIDTRTVEITELTDSHFSARISYDLTMNSQHISDCELLIEVDRG